MNRYLNDAGQYQHPEGDLGPDLLVINLNDPVARRGLHTLAIDYVGTDDELSAALFQRLDLPGGSPFSSRDGLSNLTRVLGERGLLDTPEVSQMVETLRKRLDD